MYRKTVKPSQPLDNKYDVIFKIANENMVENIISNVYKGQGSKMYLQDLSQDIYLSLIEKDDQKVIDLYNHGELSYFITKTVLNNLNSKTSPYYYNYRRFSSLSDELTNIYNDVADEQD